LQTRVRNDAPWLNQSDPGTKAALTQHLSWGTCGTKETLAVTGFNGVLPNSRRHKTWHCLEKGPTGSTNTWPTIEYFTAVRVILSDGAVSISFTLNFYT
jgi:hypothetical protein